MSIKLMSAIFETEFFDIPLPPEPDEEKPRMAKASSVKITLLALADHANDEGESAYPGLNRLETKTGLSRQGLVDVLSAIKYNGLAFVAEEVSKRRTNNYSINLDCFPKLTNKDDKRLLVKPLDQSSHLTPTSQVTLPVPVKSLDLNHQLTINETPSHVSTAKEVPDNYSIEWQIGGGQKEISLHEQKDTQMKDSANLIATGMGTLQSYAYEVAYAFMKERDILIPSESLKRQKKPIKNMSECGVKVEHVIKAVKKLADSNLTCTTLYSIEQTAIDIANKTKSERQVLEVETDASGVPMSYV